jgi:hypothetical protein
MTWRELTAIRILLLVAKMIHSPEWREEIDNISKHISVWGPISERRGVLVGPSEVK